MKRHLLIFLILLVAGTAMAQSHVSDLVVTPAFGGGTIKWYNASTSGTQYSTPTTTALVDGTTYYASQTINGVESTSRVAVTATVNSRPTPTFTVQPGATANTGADVTYTTQNGMSGYVWTFPGTLTTDYTISSGGTSTDHTVTLKYVTNGSKTVTINYTANGCTAASAASSTATTVTTTVSFSVSSIDFANTSGGTAGMLDDNDQVIITFNKEINPSTINASLVKNGSISLSNGYNQIDFYVASDWALGGFLTGWYIGTFTEHGQVNISGTGTPHFNNISLNAAGTILTFNLSNASGSYFNNASGSTYVGYTPDSNIKAADGSSITVTEIREPDGSQVF